MARIFQIKRGLKANLPTLAQGEFAMTTDSGSEALWLGTGSQNKKIPLDPTAADMGALARDGSNAMTGDLHIDGGTNDLSLYVDRVYNGVKYSANAGVFPEGNPYFGRRKNGALESYLFIKDKELRFNSETGGIYAEVLHTGNKPSGSYTGNGSEAERTIPLNTIGGAILITSAKGTAIVTGGNGIGASGGSVEALAYQVAHMTSGGMVMKTANNLLNANGITYNYRVL